MTHRKVAFVLFTAGWGANHFATLLMVYRAALGLSDAALGALYGSYALGLVPGLLLAGGASDRRGRKTLVLPAGALAVSASALLSFGGYGFFVLLLGRLLYGLGMGAIMSPGAVWMQELSPAGVGPRRATLALSAGFGLGPMVTGILVDFAPWPLVLPYVAHGLALLAALVSARALPETAHERPREPLTRSDARLLLDLLPLAPWVFAFASVTVVIVPGALRAPPLVAGLAVVTTLMTGVAVQPLTARFGDRSMWMGLAFGIAGILVAAETLALACVPLLFLAAACLGTGYGFVVTAGLRRIERRVPIERRGLAVGIYYVMTYVGFALPFLHALVARRFGDIATLGGLALLAAVALAKAHRMRVGE